MIIVKIAVKLNSTITFMTGCGEAVELDSCPDASSFWLLILKMSSLSDFMETPFGETYVRLKCRHISKPVIMSFMFLGLDVAFCA